MRESDKREASQAMRWLALAALALAVAAVLLASCTRTVYVPAESVRTEYRDREVLRLSADTVNNTRVIFVKGDTVVDIRREERLRRIEIHDTCYIERSDTIRVPCPVERKLTKWERAKMDFGGWAMAVVAIAALSAAAWMARKLKKKTG